MLYWIFKWSLFVPVVRLAFRPHVTGEDNIPDSGPAVVACNHTSMAETLLLPAMIRRRLTFPVKAELFVGGGGIGKSIVAWFLAHVGQVPMDRAGGRASATSMDSVLNVLRDGRLLGIFPEGTRSPDGRLYKGKTGVARLVLRAEVPVIPVGFINTVWVRTRPFGIPWIKRPAINIGEPVDFDRYASAAGDRHVLRYVTDEIMAAVQEQSGQEYVDAYAASVKAAAVDGRDLPSAIVRSRPGLGRPVPPVPGPAADPGPATPTADVSA
ncbi:MAG: 1-acyl-sn-glycerol-3-phosphate acyltransferase [Microlunatus sp.]|nr:1-acyl-sn-glycerol-3-phosphate acyltransferase [Microlunatus sp.]MDN5769818.1 1-acyl-sn-glycerol-3-phosphate acyltransferase [Microlunatus sp.]